MRLSQYDALRQEHRNPIVAEAAKWQVGHGREFLISALERLKFTRSSWKLRLASRQINSAFLHRFSWNPLRYSYLNSIPDEETVVGFLSGQR